MKPLIYSRNLTFLIIFLSFTGLSYAKIEVPTFETYLLSEKAIFKGPPADIDLTSYKGARTFRTKLREGAKQGPNYAGHYTVVTIGCGTQCQQNWVIEARTGKILDRFFSIIGIAYQLNSLLLVVNPPDPHLKNALAKHPEHPFWGTVETTYKILQDHKFNVLYQAKWVDIH